MKTIIVLVLLTLFSVSSTATAQGWGDRDVFSFSSVAVIGDDGDVRTFGFARQIETEPNQPQVSLGLHFLPAAEGATIRHHNVSVRGRSVSVTSRHTVGAGLAASVDIVDGPLTIRLAAGAAQVEEARTLSIAGRSRVRSDSELRPVAQVSFHHRRKGTKSKIVTAGGVRFIGNNIALGLNLERRF